MIRTIITDDEQLVRENIRMRLADHNDVTIVGTCTNGTETIRKVNDLQPDLLFLDIRMPGYNGFEVLADLKINHKLQVIVITAYDQYAVKAFEANAVDYLLKPINTERFNEALNRVRKNLNDIDVNELKILLKNLENRKNNSFSINQSKRLAIKMKNRTRFIVVDDISHLQADGDYVKIMLGENQKPYLKRDTMKRLAKKLAPSFIRIHRSYIINSEKIVETIRSNTDDLYVKLKSGIKLKVSENYKADLERLLQNSY
ncbi:LytR/AlgR family response regulator transcription factor [Fodinibius salsisoli]|uniref:Response regulator n=1 Tax=Fodinibius salsisoli TaxID=2820877 RepID=A0ABT3PN90_9BACT|nr:response regulator [Fodinibius salsisoli]MCW9707263.1 response regulator [Fodinibius salsisoli]